ncbi:MULTISPECIES: type III glutamate--ammonia ligase [unclassified Duganella]|uniref:type III glutamate--ammonia ligase n=1 Tax=unclassified Duganella TaxID=2636909 RepID=UPI000E34AB08|nr:MULTISPECIES: type III glutamate--ammonia ligase [unclassified Duganella]RFP11382.1 type III glutamate--ammonia ligase [Duganella sp. BJB475]RFP29702.1 type III glutamate--ammonia ligase [Duganella sp. BJB476]
MDTNRLDSTAARSTEELQRELAAKGVRFVFAQFTDIHGAAKGKLIPLANLDDIVSPGAGFSGPSIWGTGLPRTGPRSEYYGRADLSTLKVMPWLPGYARVALDGHVAGEPFDACPRQVLRKQVERLAQRGWTLNAGLEPEFFLLQQGANGYDAEAADTLEKPSYDTKSLLRRRGFIEKLTTSLDQCGLGVFQIDHEDATGQFEVNYKYADALKAADNFMLFKMAAQHIAEEEGLLFSMMPKPFAERPGSGLHFHLSLANVAGKPLFALGEEKEQGGRDLGLSSLAYHFMAGLLHHAPALTALCAPTVNSYKRLMCGQSLSGTSWAPAFIGYGNNNRTTVARAVYQRIEWRLPDSSANPYLALAGVIAAGLDGIDRALEAMEPVNQDVYEMSDAARAELGLKLLPQNLGVAAAALKADTVLADALGAEIVNEFVALKSAEWIEYSQHVSAWETKRYIDRF